MPPSCGSLAASRITGSAARCPAFTLLETLAVLAIVALLFALSLGAVRTGAERSALARARTELAQLASALEEFRRHYGDYPQSGYTGPETHRSAGGAGPEPGSSPAILFDAVTGAVGPHGIAVAPARGPILVALTRFATERPLVADASESAGEIPSSGSSARNAFLDPWGNRYIYVYRGADVSAAGSPFLGFRLFSAGPDGTLSSDTLNPPHSGARSDAPEDADNIQAEGTL